MDVRSAVVAERDDAVSLNRAKSRTGADWLLCGRRGKREEAAQSIGTKTTSP